MNPNFLLLKFDKSLGVILRYLMFHDGMVHFHFLTISLESEYFFGVYKLYERIDPNYLG